MYAHLSCEVGILRAVDVCGLALDCDVSDDVVAVRELGSRCVRVGTRTRRKRGAPAFQDSMHVNGAWKSLTFSSSMGTGKDLHTKAMHSHEQS